jgi:hypothetical protein
MLPFAPIVSLLIELDKRTGYLDCFTHAGGKQARSPELKRNLIAVLISHSTNLGLTRMPANLAIIDYHQKLPLTPVFGAGTLSSSDRRGYRAARPSCWRPTTVQWRSNGLSRPRRGRTVVVRLSSRLIHARPGTVVGVRNWPLSWASTARRPSEYLGAHHSKACDE